MGEGKKMPKHIAIYLRLSDQDKNTEESNSIGGQRELIQRFITNHKDISSDVSKDVSSKSAAYILSEFSDDGYSGTNFNRPSILKLLEKAKNGEIDCIIVKDFSRFGRNYLEVGTYIEEVFPFLGIRFISIHDSVIISIL